MSEQAQHAQHAQHAQQSQQSQRIPKTVNNISTKLEDTELYKSTYELLKATNIYFENAPKNKTNIRNDMYNMAKSILTNVYESVFETNKEIKMKHLKRASSQIHLLFVNSRLACDLQIISKHQYSVLIPIIASIGENLDIIINTNK